MSLPKESPKTPTLYVTADYELFLGSSSGTPEACLFEPTNRLASLLESYGKKLILFVDVFYLRRLAEEAKQNPSAGHTLEAVRKHLQELVKRGHALELHLHPHWIDARYDGRLWHFSDTSHYSIHSLSRASNAHDWKTIRGCITQGKKLLMEIGQEVNLAFEVSSFRAGGLVLQPFSEIREVLAENKLWIDSSVAPGLFSDQSARNYDYRGVPFKDSWHFEQDPTQEMASGRFFELPVLTYQATPLNKVATALDRWKEGKQTKTWGNGVSIPSPRKSLLKKMRSNRSLLTYDFSDKTTLINELKNHVINDFKSFVILGHPKFLSPYGLTQLDGVLSAGRAEGWQ